MKQDRLDFLINGIVDHVRTIEKVFFILVVICALAIPFVQVNYDLEEYLPQEAETKQALDVMEQEFGYPGLARIMVDNVTRPQAKRLAQAIGEVDGVDLVIGPDTLFNPYLGTGFLPQEEMEDFYRDGSALLEVVFTEGASDQATGEALTQIRQIVGANGHFTSTAVSKQSLQQNIMKEVATAMVLAVVIIFLILTLTTTSFFEPVLFLSVMAIAIVLNLGTNLIFGTISFFTFSTAAILQLAVSMDYSIFLLDKFIYYRQIKGFEMKEAMKAAIRASLLSISASGATTVVGFIVLIFMRFTIGFDMGLVLAKGVVLSLVTVLVLMPALVLRNYQRVEKYSHRSLMPACDRAGEVIYRLRRPILIVAILVCIPCFVAQNMNYFQYGDQAIGAGPGTAYDTDTKLIEEKFGKSNIMLALVPNTNTVREKQLTETLQDRPYVNYALSLAGTLPTGVPESFLPKDLVEQLHTKEYARILVSMNTEEESDYAFQCAEDMEQTVKTYYPDGYVLGMTNSTADIKEILTEDYARVNVLSILGVLLVVLCSFRAPLLPILVIIPIEMAIFINMAIPYFMGTPLAFMGYIIVSCVQLGATVDYSILVTNHYLDSRKRNQRADAAKKAVAKSMISILTSGSILTVVGYGLYITSTLQGVAQIGHLVGRGAILSVVMVLGVLPALLSAFDPLITRQQAWLERWKNRGKACKKEGQ